MEFSTLLVLLIGLAIGAVAGLLVARALGKSELAVARAEKATALARVDEVSASQEAMANQFKVLSAEVLDRSAERAEANADERLARTELVMAPLAESLSELNRRLVEVERGRASFAAQLSAQVTSVTQAEENLRRETASLTTALRKPQVRGAWGELTLKRVVETAGMLNHVHFYEQQTTTTSTDSTIRPDLKVMLGDDTFIYVDSKVPLTSFLEAYEAEDEGVRASRLAAFGRTVRGHVDALSKKTYWKAETANPEFVVLFIPSEALAAEALTQQPDLLEYAHGRGIVLASPTTLIGLLRAVSYGWKQAVLAESAHEVFDLARELYARLSTMGGHFDKLGRALTSSVKSYNETVGSLEGRVLVQARKFKDLELTEADLPTPSPVELSPRQLSAAELIDAEWAAVEPAVDDLALEASATAKSKRGTGRGDAAQLGA